MQKSNLPRRGKGEKKRVRPNNNKRHWERWFPQITTWPQRRNTLTIRGRAVVPVQDTPAKSSVTILRQLPQGVVFEWRFEINNSASITCYSGKGIQSFLKLQTEKHTLFIMITYPSDEIDLTQFEKNNSTKRKGVKTFQGVGKELLGMKRVPDIFGEFLKNLK